MIFKGQMKILIIYFSDTGYTKTIAEEIYSQISVFHHVDLVRIYAEKDRSYWKWLMWSFIPRSWVKIKPLHVDIRNYQWIFLGTPKWTFSCPPINQFLRNIKGGIGKSTALFMTYGGFDEDRYLKKLVKRVSRLGLRVELAFKVRRKTIQKNEYSKTVKTFLNGLKLRGGKDD